LGPVQTARLTATTFAHPGTTERLLFEYQMHRLAVAAKERGFQPKRGLDVFPSEHFAPRAAGEHLAFVRQQDVVGEARRQVEVVHHANDHQVAHFQELASLPHEFELVIDIEPGHQLPELRQRCTRWMRSASWTWFPPWIAGGGVITKLLGCERNCYLSYLAKAESRSVQSTGG